MQNVILTDMKKHFFTIGNVVIPVLVGTAFYYLFCPETLFVRRIDAILPITFHFSLDMGNKALRMLRFYLMDFLWAYSLTAMVCFCLKENIKISITILLAFELLLEALQLHPVIKGTFDLWDIAVEVCANIMAITIIFRRRET